MSIRALAAVCALLVLAGCAKLAPYRTVVAGGPGALQSDELPRKPCPTVGVDKDTGLPNGAVEEHCASYASEDGRSYKLFFAEFDDQGWLYNAEHHPNGKASEQLEKLVSELQGLTAQGVQTSVVVFAHGWKHTAASDDSNVRTFRLFLEGLDEVEQGIGGRRGNAGDPLRCPRRVIGVYLGWRGAATRLGPVENITFWNRKEAAERVAQGDARVLFAHLRAVQDVANAKWNAAVERARAQVGKPSPSASGGSASAAGAQEPTQLNPCDKMMRLSIAGHSFGGLIVHTSLSQALIRDIVELGHAEAKQRALLPEQRVRPILEREGDLVVVINPAIEATRLEPLFRAARDAKLEYYNTPTFVSITSEADGATRQMFPIGRWFDTRLAKYPDDPLGRERAANLRTFGFYDPFLTHRLSTVPDIDKRRAAPCEDWLDGPFTGKLGIEERVFEEFLGRLTEASFDARRLVGPRPFCGQSTLRLDQVEQADRWLANSPVWNVRTTGSVIKDHNDFDSPLLLAFLRQLYIESVDRSVPLARAIQQQKAVK